jgi:cytochrome c553
MKKLTLTLLCGLLAVGGLASLVSRAAAYPQFKKEFDNKYIGEESTQVERAISAAVKVAKCNVCHDPKLDEEGMESKKNRNPYGEALAQFLDKDDRKDIPKIIATLEKVEAMKAKPNGPTFGELLKQGKLPVEVAAGN